MTIPGLDAEDAAQQLGAAGVDNLVTNAERICTYEQQRIEFSNEGIIQALGEQYKILLAEEIRIEERLHAAPPPGDLRRLRRRGIYAWAITVLLTVAGFIFTLLTFAPFRLGWKSWLYCGGIAVVTPFLVEKLLEGPKMERVLKSLTAVAAVAGLASLMFLAIIRGDLLAQEIHQSAAPAVILDDAQPLPEPQNNFYSSTLVLLRSALLLMAFTMEVGAGLALREAWRSVSDNSEDWGKLRRELVEVRQAKVEIIRQATWLRNGPAIFAARFRRDFYRSLLSNAARSAMTKLLVLVIGVSFLAAYRAQAEDHLDLVIAIDLTQSVAVSGPDGKSEFQKNVDGVTRVLTETPAGSHVTVLGITDHSFAQPYILLSVRVPDDPGYFGEHLSSARSQLVRAWKLRATHLDPHFQQTDIFGALLLASQVFAQKPDVGRKMLVIFSDMRQSSAGFDMESLPIVPTFMTLATRCGAVPALHNVQVHVLGADGAARSTAYWQSLRVFWGSYLQNAGATLESYSVLRELPQTSISD